MADIDRWMNEESENDLAAPDGAAEGITVGEEVNDIMREIMASVRRTWEIDEWRDISMLKTASRCTITRDSDLQFTMTAVNRTASLPTGSLIRIVGPTTKLARVVTATLIGADTRVLCIPQGDADGTVDLGAGNLTFADGGVDTSAGAITIDRDAGTITADSGTPWGSVAAGDWIRLANTSLNDGYYYVMVATSSVLTLREPLEDEAAASADTYWIDAAAAGTITSDGSGGGGATPFSGIGINDILRIWGSEDSNGINNDGFYLVTGTGGATLTVTPMGDYRIKNDSGVAASAAHIDLYGAIPAATITEIDIAGAHSDQFDAGDTESVHEGTDPLDKPANRRLGDAAYMREQDMRVAHALDADTLQGRAQGPGNLLDADTVDGIHAVEMRKYIVTLDSDHTHNDGSGADGAGPKDIPDWTDIQFPNTPDGVKTFRVRVSSLFVVNVGNDSATVEMAIYLGPTGGSATGSQGPKFYHFYTAGFTDGRMDYEFFITPTAGQTHMTLATLGIADAGGQFTIAKHKTGLPGDTIDVWIGAPVGNNYWYPHQPGSYIEIQEVTAL